jgi:hypothetical protein
MQITARRVLKEEDYRLLVDERAQWRTVSATTIATGRVTAPNLI